MRRRVAVLGSTGSIGRQALEIIDATPCLQLHSVLCGSDTDALLGQVRRFAPALAAVVSPREEPPAGVLTGIEAVNASIEGADVVLNAIVGAAGLQASIACCRAGITLALANKESLVIGGELLADHLGSGGIVPVDSEHSTIWRCLHGGDPDVRGITLTASGGSVRDLPLESLEDLEADTVLKHPTWNMGARITVDSATMVNKAFEVIEARWLFGDLPVEVVMHPQSIVHSLVRLGDGSWKALLGEPDMRIPVQYALLWPDGGLREISKDRPADWPRLEFAEMDGRRYPAFGTVVRAGEDGGTCPAAANAADEVAVDAFLSGRIRFGHIAAVMEEVLSAHRRSPVEDLGSVMEADREARAAAGKAVEQLC